MKTKLISILKGYSELITVEEWSKLIEIPPNEGMGDLAIPCFCLAKKMHKAPALIADEIKHYILGTNSNELVDHITVVGGYCNIFFDRYFTVESIVHKALLPDFGVKKTGSGRTICMDYSSPNIAKNFHVGHLRTTIIGNSLYKIHEKLGYKVIRINHLGDWGTQFGKLIVAYKKWSSKEQVEQNGIEELLRIYVKFNDEKKSHPEFMDEARAWFVKMEKNDKEALTIWNWFKQISMVEFERVYKMLGMSFDYYMGESFYRDKVPSLVQQLDNKGLLIESDGAKVINLEQYDMPPCLILKNDGGSIYHSRDLAAILYRKETYNFDKCIYVTGLEQTLHFKQVFKAIELMGFDWYKNLVHVPYGLVSLDGEKLSTRGGNIIYAEDILNEAIKRAYDSIAEKKCDVKDKQKIAKQVGIGAVLFHDLFNQRIKNIDFKWEDVLNFDGATGPYVQYTVARGNRILEKNNYSFANKKLDYTTLTDDISYKLIKVIGEYENAINSAAECYEPSIITRYIVNLATEFNRFYHECNILNAESETKQARLKVVSLVVNILKEACGLLGMECPEEM